MFINKYKTKKLSIKKVLKCVDTNKTKDLRSKPPTPTDAKKSGADSGELS